MQAVKIFSDPSLFDIEGSINAWLQVNPKIEIVKIAQSSHVVDVQECEVLHSITIVYKIAA